MDRTGPSRDEAAMDLIVECSSGFMSITGTENGEQVRSGYAVADINAGLFSVIGILMALQYRNRTGQGQYIDVSMFDSMISAMSSNYMSHLGSGKTPQPMGTAFPTVVPYRVFRASDRVFSLAVGSEKLWGEFCQAIEHTELREHPDYGSNALRIQNRHALEARLQEIFETRTAAEWIEVLHAAGIPSSLVLNFAEVVAHPQSAFRGNVSLVAARDGRHSSRHRFGHQDVRNARNAVDSCAALRAGYAGHPQGSARNGRSSHPAADGKRRDSARAKRLVLAGSPDRQGPIVIQRWARSCSEPDD
jgi:crotonobetainyl-CoA:carnitine CoA-transferase CaiB-like acyl-CoA transferase